MPSLLKRVLIPVLLGTLITGIGFFSLFPDPLLAQNEKVITSVCSQHDFSSGGFSSCTYCHNAEEPGEAAFTIDSKSQSCLSCHDGSTTEATQHISPGSTAERIGNPSTLGKQTAVDHPFGVLYDEARLITSSLKLRPTPLPGTVKLYEGKVECASCHDPHDCSIKPFLRISNDKSGLCMACHEM